MKRYILHLTPITPVHIGTGEELIPFSYIIKDISPQKTGEYRLLRINETKILQCLNSEQKKEFISIAQKDNLIELRNFFISIADKIIFQNQDCILSLSEVTDELVGVWNELRKRPLNSLIVRPTIASARAGRGLIPYIPGSSLKGALRTAILDALPVDIKRKSFRPQDDPFRAFIVSDALFSGKRTRIVGSAHLYNRKKQSIESLQMFYEVIKGQAICIDTPVNTVCTLVINFELQSIKEFGFQIPDISDIVHRCRQFYGNLLEQEYNNFYHDAPDDIYQGFKILDDTMSNTEGNKDEFIVRLGRHSQFEYMTLNGLRKCGNPRYGMVSRTLFKYKNIYLPMGWVHIKYESVP